MRVFRATDDEDGDEVCEIALGRQLYLVKVAAPGAGGQRRLFLDSDFLGLVKKTSLTENELQTLLEQHILSRLETQSGWRAALLDVKRDATDARVALTRSIMAPSEVEISYRLSDYQVCLRCSLDLQLTQRIELHADNYCFYLSHDGLSLGAAMARIKKALQQQHAERRQFIEHLRQQEVVVLQEDTSDHRTFVVLVQHDVKSHAWLDIVQVVLPRQWGLPDDCARMWHVELCLIHAAGRTAVHLSEEAVKRLTACLATAPSKPAAFASWLRDVLRRRFPEAIESC
ncbi:hypothetical protein ACHHYP_00380 [Achlya hypogyna]|uniref:Uncharacterized protein n=1 Tax=Achlya hypogyna TaxID=1202772 RepID=A0A1V9ZAS9_ACHHY|nr:hypothetical protein ACHHYP_00380 [Achlya hypogyna]